MVQRPEEERQINYYRNLINGLEKAQKDLEDLYKKFLRPYVMERQKRFNEAKEILRKDSQDEDALIFIRKGMPLVAPKKESLFSRQGLKDSLKLSVGKIISNLEELQEDPFELKDVLKELKLLKNSVDGLIKTKTYDQELEVLRFIATQHENTKNIVVENLSELKPALSNLD